MSPSLLLAVVLAAAVGPYLAGGVLDGFFAGDDFQWLHGASSLGWQRAFDLSSRSASYRPVIDLYFVAGKLVCDRSSACYHGASLAVHVMTVAGLFTLARMLFRDLRIATLGTLLFALQPAYVQAVTWVAAIPNTLGAALMVASLLAQTQSWTASGERQGFWEGLAIVTFLLAVFAHEASIVMLGISALMWQEFGPRPLYRRRGLVAGLIGVALLFAWATWMSNRNNVLFPEGGYQMGTHVVRHAFESLAQLTVGPRWWLSDVVWIGALGWLLLGSRVTRFSAVWLLLAMTPYLGFTTGTVSRYHYVPAMGFSLALGSAVILSVDWLNSRRLHRTLWLQVAGSIVAAFLVVRFANFKYASAAGEVRTLEPWREYASLVMGLNPGPVEGAIRVPPPDDPAIEDRYLEPMFRWLFDNNDLQVIVERNASRSDAPDSSSF